MSDGKSLASQQGVQTRGAARSRAAGRRLSQGSAAVLRVQRREGDAVSRREGGQRACLQVFVSSQTGPRYERRGNITRV